MLQRKVANAEVKTVVNQFGSMQIDTAKAIHFPQGLIGISGSNNFCVAPCPHERFKNFMVIQSVDTDLCLLAMPIDIANSAYHEKGDLESTCEALGINPQDAAVLLVVSTKETESGKTLVVNTRAPVFVDTTHQLAAQFVLANSKYDMQQSI